MAEYIERNTLLEKLHKVGGCGADMRGENT